MASPAEIGPRYWARLHAWAEEFRQEIAGECGCGEFAVMAVGALHDLVNAKLGKPLYAPENFRIFRDAIDAVELSVSGHAHQHQQASGGPAAGVEQQQGLRIDLGQGRELLLTMERAVAVPPKEQLGLDLFPVAPPEPEPEPTPLSPAPVGPEDVEAQIRALEAELQRLRGLLYPGATPPGQFITGPAGPAPVGKYQPYPFQLEGIAWLKDKSAALLADDMGLGKTVQAIYWAADGRLPALVVVPAAVAYNWQNELKDKWRPGDSVTLLFTGEAEALPRRLSDWTITTYSQVQKFLPQLRRAPFKSIIIDEAQYIKTPDAKRTKAVLDLVAPEKPSPNQAPIPNRLAVTGTPIMNRPPELFPLLVFLGKAPRDGYRRFVDQYAERREAAGREYFVGYRDLEGLHQRIQPFTLRRLKKDVLTQLPPKIQRPMWVGLTNAAEYKEAERNFLEWYRRNVGDEAADKIAYSVQMQILVQIGQLRQVAARGKVKPVADFLAPCQESGHKALVFSNFIDVLEDLHEAKGGLLYTGATPKDERDEMVSQFQSDPSTCFFFGSVGAAGVGITLTAADRAVFVDLPWTPAAKAQAEDRAHRIGQTRQVEVIPFLAKGTVDELLLAKLSEKEKIIAQAIDGLSADRASQESISAGLINSYRELAFGRQAPLPIPNYLSDEDVETVQGRRQPPIPYSVVTRGQLEDAKRFKRNAFKQLQGLRRRVASLGPRAGGLRLELLKAESYWKEMVRLEKSIRETMEAWPQANQGLDPWGSRCRDPKTGEWVESGLCGPVPQDGLPALPSAPAKTMALSADGLRKYEFEHRAVEASQVIPSHDPFTFQVNPAFAQKFQPRMRDRAAAELQVMRIAAQLSPDALLTDFHTLDRGAPIVGPDMLVESGNGRVMGLIRAIQDFPENYALYKSELGRRASATGVDPALVARLKAPVLVRVRLTPLADQDRAAFVQEANVPSGISRSAIEQARTDSEKITLAMLESLEVGENEGIIDALRSPKNAAFVRAFLGSLAANEQAQLLDSQGRVNQDGLRRASQAIFVSAFGGGEPGLRLGEMAFESADQDVRTVFNGISRALGPLAKAESLVRNKARDVNLSIGDDLARTVGVYAKIKNDPSLTVAKYLDQSQMFERELTPFQEVMLRSLDEHRRSAKRLGAIFSAYAGLVDALPPPEQGGLFGPAEPPSKEIVWDQALRRAEQPEQSKEREAVLVQGQDVRTAWESLLDAQRELILRSIGASTEWKGANWQFLPYEIKPRIEQFFVEQGTVKKSLEVKGQYASRIRWCNTPEKARESILNWRPLRNLLYQGIAYQVAVEVCEAGFGGDQYQVSIGYRAEGAWRKGYLTGGQVKALRGTAESMGASLFKEVLTRDPGVLIFQVTLPGAEAEDLVLKPQFPEEKPREERVDPRLQPALFQGVAAATMAAEKKLRTWRSVLAAIDSWHKEGIDLYVNWSRLRPRSDSVSYNSISNRNESGLSVVALRLVRDENLEVLTANHPERYTELIVDRFTEYIFLYFEKGARPWIVTGEVVGKGGDGEPLLANVRVLASVTVEAADEAWKLRRGRLNNSGVTLHEERGLFPLDVDEYSEGKEEDDDNEDTGGTGGDDAGPGRPTIRHRKGKKGSKAKKSKRGASSMRQGEHGQPVKLSNAFLSMVLGGAAQAVGAAIGFSIGNTLAGAVKTKPPEPTFQVVRCQEDETWDEKAQVCRPKDQGVPKGRSGAGLPAVVNPGYVEGDQAQVDIGNLLEELDVILKNPQTMGEVDANTLRVVRG